ncbi:metallophosphoesterase family protein [Marinobacterium weihaiense]|uniref:Metallophosphoesterase family protein n=1 Tax=Marinobacterium weihaiense TaxID=2851016 RepID=A0ABS6M9Z7_9GAMM|nr:metallophosphoesterase family protein [Marinobacterium weihaiense]MBV0932597.1 metallophosphoesterase family protein [Marinobacterium weihaiense]
MLKKKLKIVGALGERLHFGPEQIRATILQGMEVLSINSDFMGRPATNIYANDVQVVKIRRELKLTARQAQPWLTSVMAKERELGVYHPAKTWFYIYAERDGVELENEEVLIGNITPRLQPLHKVLEAAPSDVAATARARSLLDHMFGLYLRTAHQFGVKLDEGLSNFAIDAQDRLYYVDDEFYGWDKFISFAMMLGVLIRKLNWLERDFARALAYDLGQQLDSIFGDLNYRASVAYQLRSAFMPAGKKRDLANLISSALTEAEQEPVAPAVPPAAMSSSDEANVAPAPVQPAAVNLTPAPAPAAAVVPVAAAPAVAPPIPAVETPSTPDGDATAPWAILADVHANLPALEAVLAWLQREGIERGIVLGDLVGYGPDAAEVIERLRGSGLQIIKGNHDHAVALGSFQRGLSKNARHVAQWTHEQLSEEQREWLKRLPPVLDTEHWMAVHGAPLDPEFFYGYVYEMTYRDNLDKLAALGRKLCLHGHSHMPGVYGRDAKGQDRHWVEPRVSLQAFSHALVCPGSVGQPRNGTPHTQFAVYDPINEEVRFESLEYDFEPVVERMKANHFPADLYMRMPKGV